MPPGIAQVPTIDLGLTMESAGESAGQSAKESAYVLTIDLELSKKSA